MRIQVHHTIASPPKFPLLEQIFYNFVNRLSNVLRVNYLNQGSLLSLDDTLPPSESKSKPQESILAMSGKIRAIVTNLAYSSSFIQQSFAIGDKFNGDGYAIDTKW